MDADAFTATLTQSVCVCLVWFGFFPPGAQAPPIAIASHDVIVQPRVTVTLDGIESRPLGDAHIVDYKWTRVSGDAGVRLEVKLVGGRGLAQVKVRLPVGGAE